MLTGKMCWLGLNNTSKFLLFQVCHCSNTSNETIFVSVFGIIYNKPSQISVTHLLTITLNQVPDFLPALVSLGYHCLVVQHVIGSWHEDGLHQQETHRQSIDGLCLIYPQVLPCWVHQYISFLGQKSLILHETI